MTKIAIIFNKGCGTDGISSFFLNNYNIADSVLMYFGQTLIFCGSVFGINIYINTKVKESENRIRDEINKKLG